MFDDGFVKLAGDVKAKIGELEELCEKNEGHVKNLRELNAKLIVSTLNYETVSGTLHMGCHCDLPHYR
jgi:hypothetical protein